MELSDFDKVFDKRRWWYYILPQECIRHPLEIIVGDFTCAEETLPGIPVFSPVFKHVRVFDYVRFIVEFDFVLEKTDHFRVVLPLGVTPQ